MVSTAYLAQAMYMYLAQRSYKYILTLVIRAQGGHIQHRLN